jgi:flagellar motor switch protein FliG
MLGRFRKPGGFQQLLSLMESCDQQKRQNLLQLVGTEDPGWAYLVKAKSLSFERILSWPVDVLMEITPYLPDRILVTAYHMAEALSKKNFSDCHERWLQSLPVMKAKEIYNLAQSSSINPIEHHATAVKIIQTVRELEAKGQIRFSNFDPALEIDQRIAA